METGKLSTPRATGCYAASAVSPMEFARLWGELVEAYHGKNGFGGDTAEIYSYRVQKYSPTVHGTALKGSAFKEEQEFTHYREAAIVLHSLVMQFCSEWNCTATMDGMEPEAWVVEATGAQYRYDHRCHVKIVSA